MYDHELLERWCCACHKTLCHFMIFCSPTGKLPEGCTENPYHRIAVTIFACFCTDQDLVSKLYMLGEPHYVLQLFVYLYLALRYYTVMRCKFKVAHLQALHPQITSKIPTFNDFLLEPR